MLVYIRISGVCYSTFVLVVHTSFGVSILTTSVFIMKSSGPISPLFATDRNL